MLLQPGRDKGIGWGAAWPGWRADLSRHLPPPAAGDARAQAGGGAPHAWRLDMARALAGVPVLSFEEEADGPTVARPEPFGDVVLARRDAPASYHLCVTHDDAAQGITLVTRGMDLKPATHLHRLLQHLMAWPVPRYAHHGLVLDAQGAKLSKRHGAARLRVRGETALR